MKKKDKKISIRVNVGEKEYKDKNGNIWCADKAYNRGSWGCCNLPQTDILATSESIADTENEQLFRSIRAGEELIYRFDLPAGNYEANLLFAEIYWESSSAEMQDVYIQNKKVLKNFNIFDEAGHDKAIEKKYKVKVEKGYLEIKFIGRSLPMHSGARVSAIEINQMVIGRQK